MKASTISGLRRPRAASSLSSVKAYSGGERRSIRARARAGIVEVDRADDLREDRDFVAAQAVGIAAAVEALVVVPDDLADEPQRTQLAAQPVADHGVLLHQLELFARERRRLEQQGVRDADLADVVQVAAAIEGRDILGGPAERRPERHGIVRQPLAVPVGVLVARFDDERQAPRMPSVESRSSVYCFRRTSDATRACSSSGSNGLPMKSSAPACRPRILCSRAFSPVTSATGMSLVSGAVLELSADLEAVDAGHLDVEQHQIDVHVTKRGDGLGAGGHRHDLIAIASAAIARATPG